MQTDNINRAIAKFRPDIMVFLADIVGINSFSRNRTGVNRVAERVVASLPRGFSCRTISGKDLGDHHICTRLRAGRAPIILAGHLDTLCPEDPEFNKLIAAGDRLLGPGVNDMKSGVAVIVWALRVLEECGLLNQLSIRCIFNGDEELGSFNSYSIFAEQRGNAQAALVYECGGPEGTIVTTREGIQRFRLTVTGKGAHFGNLKERKVSAIEELAHKILDVEKMNGDPNLSVNVGRIEGGLAANKVAEQSFMDFELRYWDPALQNRVNEFVASLVKTIAVPGCQCRVEGLSHRPPMKPTPESRRLFERIAGLGARLGETIKEEKRGGVSDACWLADAGIPTIDGLGPLGDNDFTRDEYIRAETLFQRIALTAHLLAEWPDN